VRLCLIGTVSTPDPKDRVTGKLHPVVIAGDSLDALGWYDANPKDTPGDPGTWYCCHDTILGDSACGTPGTVIVNPLFKDSVTVLDPIQLNDTNSYAFTAEYPVQKSGVYILLIANCDLDMWDDRPDNETALRIEGNSYWMNPYGYLPGRLFGFMPVCALTPLIALLILLPISMTLTLTLPVGMRCGASVLRRDDRSVRDNGIAVAGDERVLLE
jgi:hypothetical protein